MTLGGMNPARYDAKSTVTVKNLNKLGFWETPINEVKIDGKPTGWTNRTGVLDTGTVRAFSLILMAETYICCSFCDGDDIGSPNGTSGGKCCFVSLSIHL